MEKRLHTVKKTNSGAYKIFESNIKSSSSEAPDLKTKIPQFYKKLVPITTQQDVQADPDKD